MNSMKKEELVSTGGVKTAWSDKKRLFVYLAFAFGLTWIFFLPYVLTGHRFGEEGVASGMDQFVTLGMLCPMMGMILTRWISREGFSVTGEGSMMLGIDLKNKKWIIYLIVIFLPWLYFEAGNGLILLLAPEAFTSLDSKTLSVLDGNAANVIWLPIASIVSAMVTSFAALGEEAGWRGYMMPKMMKLWGNKKAILIGGIIWGMWHWPLTVVGHNFGTDYFGYPYLGMISMCILCVFIGIILTYVTCKTGSIWPAVILHAVNNVSPSVLGVFIDREKIIGWKGNSIVIFMVSFIPMFLIAIVFFILSCKKRSVVQSR